MIRIVIPALALAVLAEGAPAKPRPDGPVSPAGKPESCIPIAQIRETRVRDDRTIDFFVGSRVYRNVLPNACPSLGYDKAFSYSTSQSQLCSVDIITVFRNGQPGIPGPSCGLGSFQPVTGVRR